MVYKKAVLLGRSRVSYGTQEVVIRVPDRRALHAALDSAVREIIPLPASPASWAF